MSETFECEGCGIPLDQDSLVDADGIEEMEEHEAGNMPGACPECGAIQWETW